jgi:hypothetical protein
MGAGLPANGDASLDTVRVAGGAAARSLASRAVDFVNVLDFGADPTGTVDSAPAFTAAAQSVPLGAAVAIRAPKGTYLLNSVVGTSGRIVAVLLDDGANISSGSPGYLGVTRVEGTAGSYVARQRGGGFFGIVAGPSLTLDDTTNDVGLNANVFDERYQNANRWAASGGSQDQHRQVIAQWLTLADSSGWLDWKVAVGPLFGEFEAATLGFAGSLQAGEIDVAANTPESGWSDVDGEGVAAAGYSLDPSGGNAPGLGGHIRYAWGSAGGVTGTAGPGSLNNRWWTYPALFSAINPPPTGAGAAITIAASNGAGTSYGPTTITVGGVGALADWAAAVNAAAIPGVAAAVSIWGGSLARVVIFSTVANNLGAITLGGAALGALGYAAGAYFTPRQSQYVTIFGGARITGAAGATFTLNGHAITVGGAGATADVVAAINGQHLTGIIAGINVAGRLVVEAWAGSQQLAAPYWSGQVYPSLTVAGSGAAAVGLPVGIFFPPSPPLAFATAFSENNPLPIAAGSVIGINGIDVAIAGSATAIAAAIVAAGIANVTAFSASGGRLVIRQTAGGTLALQDVTGRALDLLGIVGGGALATFQPGGYSAGTFNVFFAAPDSVAPAGRGLHVGGSSYADRSVWPHAPIEARGNYHHGPRVDRATFGDGVGYRLGADQAIAAGPPGADQQLVFGDGTVRLAALGQAQGAQIGQLYGTSAPGAPAQLTADGAAPNGANAWPVPAGRSLFGDLRVCAVNPATGDIAAWSITLAAKNANGTLAIVTPGGASIAPTFSTGGMAAAGLTVTANVGLASINLLVTPPAGIVARCQASFVGVIA